MASENPPVLFPARFPAGLPKPHHNRASSAKTLGAQLVQTMAATLNAPDGLLRITEVLGRQLGAEGCLLLRYHHSTKNLFYTFWQAGEPVKSWTLSANAASPQTELQCRVALSLMSQSAGQSFAPNSLPWWEGLQALLRNVDQPLAWLEQIQACSAIPVTATPDMDGALLLLHTPMQPSLTLDKTQELELAGLLAIAFHQHYLQDQARRSNEQLSYLNYLKEDFLSTLNHELRTPLTSMMLAIRMLRRPDLTPERAAMYLDILDQQCSREINLVNDLLMLQSVGANHPKTTVASTDLAEFLKDVAEREQGQFARSKVNLALNLPSQSVVLATSKGYLTRVLQELLTNARKYAHPGSTITLTLQDEVELDQRVKLCLTNTGAGIYPEELPHIFDKFHRGQNATKNGIPGTGTGLALVKGLLEQLNGTIVASSRPLNQHLWETCFTIELPTAPMSSKCG
jgi:signal transduction histidine kinase